jgi:Cytochrome C'
MKRFAALTIVVALVSQGGAFAHEAGEHNMSHDQDPRMLVLHKIMPKFARAQVRISEALKERNTPAVKSETGEILKSLPELKKARPHKNLRNLPTFRKIADAFEKEIRATAALAKVGNYAEAARAFAKAQKRCDECHAKFRD